MKKTKWINGNKMLFESEHKAFNNAVDCISTGNVIGKVQLSGFIRPFNELKCNGRVNEPGHLQNYDLNGLNKYLPYSLKEWIRQNGKTKSMIGYSFFYYRGNKKTYIGYVVTDDEHNHLKTVYARFTRKTISALDECKKYICN